MITTINEPRTGAPVLSVITEKRNGPLIAAAARLYIKSDDLLLDATYGEGAWHTDYKHPEALLIRHDKYKLDGVDYHELPEGDASVDVVFLDVPYTSAGNIEKSTLNGFHDAYGITSQKGYKAIFEDMAGAITECARVLNRGGRLFLKLSDYVESGHMRWAWRNADDAATAAGLRHADEIIHFSGTGPQPKTNLDGSPRRQVHSRRAHSFLEIYVKTR